ncbi:ead/Ea22-like family protein [Klebsiella michiganensis]|uniref:ead/Ea22-like family protein n=1 Tax=Klebsiella michiganensis TaxID=1134687 RepID=UPI0006692DDC|nr:ead/Ea22-like family protein [Klebsiella michiganensis]
MTTDITELAQSLKAAAENAIGAHERLAAYPYGEIIDISQHEGEQIDIDITDLNEFNKEANPVNILALVEALEKAQQRIAVLEEAEQKLCAANVTLDVRAELAERQLAGLESRTVTVKLPDLRQIVSGDRYVWSDGVYNYSQDVKVVLAAAGIKVEVE